jgi:GNAT superfamily N-acetyltransferase
MTEHSKCQIAAVATVTRLGEDDWRRWREVRLAALWRGSGVAGILVDAVAAWGRSGNAVRVNLWVPDDQARAPRFYQRQGFRLTGNCQSFPGDPDRSIGEMWLALART